MGKESVLPLGTELSAPLESTAAPGLGWSRGLPREVLGMRVEFGTLLSASCQNLKHEEALILTSTSPQQTYSSLQPEDWVLQDGLEVGAPVTLSRPVTNPVVFIKRRMRMRSSTDL